jgi:hypothetical protein
MSYSLTLYRWPALSKLPRRAPVAVPRRSRLRRAPPAGRPRRARPRSPAASVPACTPALYYNINNHTNISHRHGRPARHSPVPEDDGASSAAPAGREPRSPNCERDCWAGCWRPFSLEAGCFGSPPRGSRSFSDARVRE